MSSSYKAGNRTGVVTVSDARNTRRLPTWMLPVNADKLEIPASVDAKCSLSAEETKSKAAGSKIKVNSVIKKHDKTRTQEAEIKQNAESLQACETRRRTRKITKRDEVLKASLSTCGDKKRPKRKTMEDGTELKQTMSIRKQRVKIKIHKITEVEAESPERSDEDVTLTVEDMLRIAEEYVSADKEKQCEQQFKGDYKTEANPSSLSMSSKADSRGALQACVTSQILSKCTTTGPNSHLIENEGKERENDKIENFASNLTSTGDAAQDMLNLYLGPFLTKPPCVEQSVQAVDTGGLPLVQTVESKAFPNIESKGFPSVFELNKQIRYVISKEEAPLMKKKSSLKDKVSMFFH